MANKFTNLLSPVHQTSIELQQKYARENFPSLIKTTPFTLRHPGDRLAEGKTLIIGIAADYSIPDLELMDHILESNPCITTEIAIQVFNAGACHSVNEVLGYFPDVIEIGDPHTPFVGVYKKQILYKFLSGFAARSFLEAECY